MSRPVPPEFFTQAGAVPLRQRKGRAEVLLVTTRGRGRWIVPKGVVDPGTTPAESAEREAWEEAGVRGRLLPEPLGTYRYEKWGGTCTVEVFALAVAEVAKRWPEPDRKRRWVLPEKAAALVEEPGLQAILAALPADLAGEKSAP